MRVKAFPALVPAPGLAASLASVPYDVINTDEARALAEGLPNSFLRVERAELELPAEVDPYSEEVYAHARANFDKMQKDGIFIREPEPCLYLYRQIMNGRAQMGITLACHIEDYENDIIKKHEKTRKVKEDDRTRLTDVLSANTGPVFLTYKDVAAIDSFIENWIAAHEPTDDFIDDVAVQHTVWRVTGTEAAPILSALGEVPFSYVADGHHRSASAARVGKERREANPDHDGTEDYNWFLAVMFPASQLNIMPYNRVVKDLNGLSADSFLQRLAGKFHLDSKRTKSARPRRVRLRLPRRQLAHPLVGHRRNEQPDRPSRRLLPSGPRPHPHPRDRRSPHRQPHRLHRRHPRHRRAREARRQRRLGRGLFHVPHDRAAAHRHRRRRRDHAAQVDLVRAEAALRFVCSYAGLIVWK